ncbi:MULTISPECIES: 3-oxo-tetronate kinase [Roseobacteraceae]|uniref:3-oxo-tetronate kinase n=1 Tax=Pseudosulfitobacter pseudonitzschiae TaxID=1402135 RepID=A0A221JZK3_9RHOB|nr:MULTISPECIES: 3-oxo-tetronate kinase [Roseobacteraceae]ASM72186.1 HPr kinase [Pseudosulfitobacter pseudonitzschiae]
MSTVLGAIADDFTGATDLAGLLARSGARVSLRIGVPEGPVEDAAPFEVIALKIRTAPVAEAVAQARAAQAWLAQAGARRFFWKYCSTFDSTAEGNIGPVAEALMQATGAQQTIYCPAFPENGRTVFMGNLFVGQVPLAESPMKDHPLTPMRDSNLVRLLLPQVTRDAGLVDRLTVARGVDAVRAALAQAAPHVVVDAVADSDLNVIAEACRDAVLMTGGSAVAMPLPDLYRASGLLQDAGAAAVWRAPDGPALVLSGSCSAMTQAQVARYAASNPSYRLDPLALARDGVQPVLDWLAGQSGAPLIYATAAPDVVRAAQDALGRDKAGAVVEDALGRIACAARDSGTRRIVVAGGESAGAVTQALGVTRLDIGPEIAPGVPWCAATSDGQTVALALKSGNFGTEDFFAIALEMLDK